MDGNELIIKEEIKTTVYILRLSGDITKTSGDVLLQWRNWETGLPDGVTVLLIDFSRVSYINSAGIAALIRLVRFCSGGSFRSGCFGLNYHYEKLFTMVGLNKYLKVYPSEWAAAEQITSGHM